MRMGRWYASRPLFLLIAAAFIFWTWYAGERSSNSARKTKDSEVGDGDAVKSTNAKDSKPAPRLPRHRVASDLNVLVALIARNNEKHLPFVLKNVERLSTIVNGVHVIVVENDSNDKTIDVFINWAKNLGVPAYREMVENVGSKWRLPYKPLETTPDPLPESNHSGLLSARAVSFHDGSGQKSLGTLALARNGYLHALRTHPWYEDIDYLFPLDTDMCHAWRVTREEETNAEGWDVIFTNLLKAEKRWDLIEKGLPVPKEYAEDEDDLSLPTGPAGKERRRKSKAKNKKPKKKKAKKPLKVKAGKVAKDGVVRSSKEANLALVAQQPGAAKHIRGAKKGSAASDTKAHRNRPKLSNQKSRLEKRDVNPAGRNIKKTVEIDISVVPAARGPFSDWKVDKLEWSVAFPNGVCGWYMPLIPRNATHRDYPAAPYHPESFAFYCDRFAYKDHIVDRGNGNQHFWMNCSLPYGGCTPYPGKWDKFECVHVGKGSPIESHEVAYGAEPFTKVISAFGGAAMYNAAFLRLRTDCEYGGSDCEHISFNECLGKDPKIKWDSSNSTNMEDVAPAKKKPKAGKGVLGIAGRWIVDWEGCGDAPM